MSPRSINRALRRFRRNRRGSAAIEFALVAPLFFVLLFAIMETALLFFAGQVLETGTQDSARLMLTHQAQDSGMTQPQFSQNLCDRVKLLFTCDDSTTSPLVVSVKSYRPGVQIPAADLANPIANGAFVGKPAYEMSSPGDTVLVRTFYQWPLFVTRLGYDIANLRSGSDSKRLLSSTYAFRVEPP
jgi:Flp pilus assembly protein TadG